jgi:parallel beta-helix repeat protein
VQKTAIAWRRVSVALACAAACACGHRDGTGSALTPADAAFQAQLLQQLGAAGPGAVVQVAAGRHLLDRTLALAGTGVTLTGAGAELSILSFKGHGAAQGVRVQGSGVTIANLAIEDSGADALTIRGNHVVVRGVRASWSGGPQARNGAYGIHVQGAHDVLIEDSAAYSASGAGIYVQQSRSVIVRRCHAEQNVAGIALSDVVAADVSDSLAAGNSTGILVATLSPQPSRAVRLFANKIQQNNLGNFAAADTPFARLPSGAGVLLNAARDVEVFDNDFAGNQGANLLICADFFATDRAKSQPGLLPGAIFVYGNRFSGGGNAPFSAPLKALQLAKFAAVGHLPDLVWDGFAVPADGASAPGRICIKNDPATVLNADAPHGYRNPDASLTPFDCTLPKLPAVALSAGG